MGIRDCDEVVEFSDIIFVPIQTPHDPFYDGVTRLPNTRVDFDYSFLKKGMENLSEKIDKLGKDKIVVIISTVLPGTINREIKPILFKTLTGIKAALKFNVYAN